MKENKDETANKDDAVKKDQTEKMDVVENKDSELKNATEQKDETQQISETLEKKDEVVKQDQPEEQKVEDKPVEASTKTDDIPIQPTKTPPEIVKPIGDAGDQPVATATTEQASTQNLEAEKKGPGSEKEDAVKTTNLVLEQPTSQEVENQ